MTKRIMAVGNGDELHEAVNGRVYRHVYDERTQRYIPIQDDFDGSTWANCRRERISITIADMLAAPLTALEAQNMHAISEAEMADIEVTQAAASNRYGY
jgi:hypothetical protein